MPPLKEFDSALAQLPSPLQQNLSAAYLRCALWQVQQGPQLTTLLTPLFQRFSNLDCIRISSVDNGAHLPGWLGTATTTQIDAIIPTAKRHIIYARLSEPGLTRDVARALAQSGHGVRDARATFNIPVPILSSMTTTLATLRMDVAPVYLQRNNAQTLSPLCNVLASMPSLVEVSLARDSANITQAVDTQITDQQIFNTELQGTTDLIVSLRTNPHSQLRSVQFSGCWLIDLNTLCTLLHRHSNSLVDCHLVRTLLVHGTLHNLLTNISFMPSSRMGLLRLFRVREVVTAPAHGQGSLNHGALGFVLPQITNLNSYNINFRIAHI